jgi:L-aminopeptidase/D-esterase-like protein
MARPGRLNLITDVAGLRVGHAADERVRTGVTALLCPGGWNAAVDVRGGGPGERELSALSLENLVGQAHAIVLSGGSVFGLGAGDGATAALSLQGQGLKLHPASPHLPIVPTAILHDLGNGGDKAFGLEPPYHRLGIEAVEAAAERFALGLAGAGRGAMAGLVPGGLGSASMALDDGLVVGALVAINPLGSVFMPDGKTFWAWPFEMDDEFGGRRPDADMPRAHAPMPALSRLKTAGRVDAGANTTLAIVAVNAALSGPQLKRVAIMAHDGMARAVHPAHTPFDGDIVFAVAKGDRPVDSHAEVAVIGSAAADALARAIARGVYESNRAPA